MNVDVKVCFKGVVTVSVPSHLGAQETRALAETLALARVVATTDNPDAPEEDAFEDYKKKLRELKSKATKTAASDWVNTLIGGVGGSWTLGDESEDG